MLREGKVAFSPIAFGHPLTALGLPTGWDFWRPFNTECLMRCDELHVLLFDRWDQSKGVQTEIAIARMLGKPVRYRVVE
jgi:hypothetical protein